MYEWLDVLKQWTNENAGFLTLILFMLSLLYGWGSGIFKGLRKRPRFELELSPGPTFCCTFETGRESNGQKTHRTAIALYLTVCNIGSAPSSIGLVSVGLHTYTIKYSFLWYWLHQAIAIRDFGHTIGDNVRVFPFLFQQNILLSQQVNSYLKEGEQVTGVVYFEQEESWGGFRPITKDGKTRIKVRVKDVFGRSHSKRFSVPIVDLDYARKFNPEFGNSLETLQLNDFEEWGNSEESS